MASGRTGTFAAAFCLLPSIALGCGGSSQVRDPSSAADRSTAVLAALSPEAREASERSRLPVLMFGEPAIAATASVMSEEHWVAVAARDGERSLALHASDVIASPPPGVIPQPQGRVRGRPATFGESDGIRSVAWEEDAIGYSLDVECARPTEDPACADERYVRELAESLVWVARRGVDE